MIKKIIISFVFFYSLGAYAANIVATCTCYEEDLLRPDYLGDVLVVGHNEDEVWEDASIQCVRSFAGLGGDFFSGGDRVYPNTCSYRRVNDREMEYYRQRVGRVR